MTVQPPFAGRGEPRIENVARRIGRSDLLAGVRDRSMSELRRGTRPAKTYRGSARRVRRLRMRGNMSWELWALIAWVVFLLLVIIPWMARQGH